MTRNLKALGRALAAALAIGAVAASGAVAQQGTLTSDGPVTQIATQTGGAGANTLSAFGLTIECPGSSYTGHKYNVTPNELIPNGATTATLFPHFNQANHNCKAGSLPLTIELNGCDDVVHLGETTGGVAGTYGVTLDFVCPAGKEVAVTIWTNTTDETNNVEPFCILRIPPQTGLKGLHVTDTGNGHVDFIGTIEGVKASRSKGSNDAPILCPTQETTAAKISLDLTGKGLNAAGEPTAISLSHP